ncbi:MAG: zf-HC2 domain-containing protein [Myxococcota bacterium]
MREVGGIRCDQVLERLSDYVDGSIDEADRKRIEAHLQGCLECERFGRGFGAMVLELGRCRPVAVDEQAAVHRMQALFD